MTKKCLFFLPAALLAAALTACAPQVTAPENFVSTLPSFHEEKTPLQQLEAAIAAAESAPSATISYGTIRTSGEDRTEDLHSQTVSETRPFDRDELYAAVAYFPTNEAFLQAFCSSPLRAIPSNTGIIRYQLTDLSWDNAASLLYGVSADAPMEQAVCAVSMDVDSEGRLCRLEVTMETETQSLTLFIQATFSDSQ